MKIAASTTVALFILSLSACNNDTPPAKLNAGATQEHNASSTVAKQPSYGKHQTTPEPSPHEVNSGSHEAHAQNGRKADHNNAAAHSAGHSSRSGQRQDDNNHSKHGKHAGAGRPKRHTSHDQHAQKSSHGSHTHHNGSAKPAKLKSIEIGDTVPDFEVAIDGKKRKLSELQKDASLSKSGVVMLTFWCSFCHSCRDVERPLDAVAKKHKGQAAVIAIDASAGETTEEVAAFAKKRKLSLPIALNADGAAADLFGVRVTTTTVVIDGKGVLRYRGRFADRRHTYAEDALKNVLAGQTVKVAETTHRG